MKLYTLEMSWWNRKNRCFYGDMCFEFQQKGDCRYESIEEADNAFFSNSVDSLDEYSDDSYEVYELWESHVELCIPEGREEEYKGFEYDSVYGPMESEIVRDKLIRVYVWTTEDKADFDKSRYKDVEILYVNKQ